MPTHCPSWAHFGRCDKGNSCRFAHDAAPQRPLSLVEEAGGPPGNGAALTTAPSRKAFLGPPRPDPNKPPLYKTQLCWRFEAGSCYLDSSCTFAHGEHELRPNPYSSGGASGFAPPLPPPPPLGARERPRPPAVSCRNWLAGHCKYGSDCHFAHGPTEQHGQLPATGSGGGLGGSSNGHSSGLASVTAAARQQEAFLPSEPPASAGLDELIAYFADLGAMAGHGSSAPGSSSIAPSAPVTPEVHGLPPTPAAPQHVQHTQHAQHVQQQQQHTQHAQHAQQPQHARHALHAQHVQWPASGSSGGHGGSSSGHGGSSSGHSIRPASLGAAAALQQEAVPPFQPPVNTGVDELTAYFAEVERAVAGHASGAPGSSSSLPAAPVTPEVHGSPPIHAAPQHAQHMEHAQDAQQQQQQQQHAQHVQQQHAQQQQQHVQQPQHALHALHVQHVQHAQQQREQQQQRHAQAQEQEEQQARAVAASHSGLAAPHPPQQQLHMHQMQQQQLQQQANGTSAFGPAAVDSSSNSGGGGGHALDAELLGVLHRRFHSLLCPITLEPFVDPVVAADGTVYEREAIQAWLEGHATSPLTNEVLPHKLLTPCPVMRRCVEEAVALLRGVRQQIL